MCLNQTEWENNKYIKYEIRQIDAWIDSDGTWFYNTSYHIGEYKTKVDNARAFLTALHKYGISCKRGCCKVTFDGDCYELIERKTTCPLFCAVPLY